MASAWEQNLAQGSVTTAPVTGTNSQKGTDSQNKELIFIGFYL